MRKDKILLIFLIVLAFFIVFVVAQSSSPTPSQTPMECDGKGELRLEESTILEGSRLDLTKKVNRKKIIELIKKLNEKLQNNQQTMDFFECKYPADFKCNTNNCKVIFSQEGKISLIPINGNPEIMQGSSHSGNGIIELSFSYANLVINVGRPPEPPNNGENNREYQKEYNEWLNNLLETVMPSILKEISNIKNELSKKYPCPEGYVQSIVLIPDFSGVKFEKYYLDVI